MESTYVKDTNTNQSGASQTPGKRRRRTLTITMRTRTWDTLERLQRDHDLPASVIVRRLFAHEETYRWFSRQIRRLLDPPDAP